MSEFFDTPCGQMGGSPPIRETTKMNTAPYASLKGTQGGIRDCIHKNRANAQAFPDGKTTTVADLLPARVKLKL